MNLWNKIIDGAAGFALRGPLGTLLKGITGINSNQAVNDEASAQNGQEKEKRVGARRVAFTIAVIALGAKMAKADGIVSRSEIDAFKDIFHVPPEEMENVGKVFDLARQDPRGFESYARQIARMFGKKHPVLEELLNGLFYIAKADGYIHELEIDFILEVSRIFGFDDEEFARIREANLGQDKADPYRILGIKRNASNEDIKAARRKLARDNHPDRLLAMGLPTEFIAMANERSATINAAYDKIAKERGLI